MGFFDDDSDDEDDRKPRQIGLLDLQQSTNATTSDDKNEDEEEDPLDAYMKSLNDETNDAKKGKGGDREESLDSTSSQFGASPGRVSSYYE